jgi:hypothetical protein
VNNKLVTAEERGAKPLIAKKDVGQDPTKVLSSETFTVSLAGNGKAVIFSYANNRYVVVDNAGNLVATGFAPGASGSFEVTYNDDGSHSLRAANGMWVTASNRGDGPLNASGPAIGDPQKFDLLRQGTVAIRNINMKKFVAAQGGGTFPLIASVPSVGAAQTFYRVDLPDGTTALMAVNNVRYVHAARLGQDPLIANETEIWKWSAFTVVPSDTPHSLDVKLKAANGNYVGARANAAGVVVLRANEPVVPNPPVATSFRIMPIW